MTVTPRVDVEKSDVHPDQLAGRSTTTRLFHIFIWSSRHAPSAESYVYRPMVKSLIRAFMWLKNEYKLVALAWAVDLVC